MVFLSSVMTDEGGTWFGDGRFSTNMNWIVKILHIQWVFEWKNYKNSQVTWFLFDYMILKIYIKSLLVESQFKSTLPFTKNEQCPLRTGNMKFTSIIIQIWFQSQPEIHLYVEFYTIDSIVYFALPIKCRGENRKRN